MTSLKLLLIFNLYLFLFAPSVFSQKKYNIEAGIDISIYKNIIGQREFLIRLRSEESALLNPFLRFGFGERRVHGGCAKDDYYDNQKTQGWFFRAGNHFRIGENIYAGPIFMFANETNSAVDSVRIKQSRVEQNFYAGLNLSLPLLIRKKWGIDVNMSLLYAFTEQSFWGSSCNDTKMGVGSAFFSPLYGNINTMVYYKF